MSEQLLLSKDRLTVEDVDNKLIRVKGYYQDIMEYVQTHDCNIKQNDKEFRSHLTKSDDSGWIGGDLEDVTTNDRFLQEFLKTKEQLGYDELFDTVRSKIGKSRARKRVSDEHDGDYDYSRQWDIKPYSRGVVAAQPTRVIDVFVDFSISSGTNQKQINEYACGAWALVDILESFGVSCNIYLVNQVRNLTEDHQRDGEFIIKLKSSSEYFSPLAVSRSMNSVFFRRVLFAMMIHSCDMTNRAAAYGLGTPRHMGNSTATFENGAIKMSCSGIFGPAEVQNVLAQVFSESGV